MCFYAQEKQTIKKRTVQKYKMIKICVIGVTSQRLFSDLLKNVVNIKT